jgi:hypothetical protein
MEYDYLLLIGIRLIRSSLYSYVYTYTIYLCGSCTCRPMIGQHGFKETNLAHPIQEVNMNDSQCQQQHPN